MHPPTPRADLHKVRTPRDVPARSAVGPTGAPMPPQCRASPPDRTQAALSATGDDSLARCGEIKGELLMIWGRQVRGVRAARGVARSLAQRAVTNARRVTGTLAASRRPSHAYAGPSQDPHVPLEGRAKIHAALTAAGTNFQWLELNGQHAFMCGSRAAERGRGGRPRDRRDSYADVHQSSSSTPNPLQARRELVRPLRRGARAHYVRPRGEAVQAHARCGRDARARRWRLRGCRCHHELNVGRLGCQ